MLQLGITACSIETFCRIPSAFSPSESVMLQLGITACGIETVCSNFSTFFEFQKLQLGITACGIETDQTRHHQ